MLEPQYKKIQIDFDVPIKMRDGVILKAVVYRPEREGQWPVLLTRLPYSKDYAASSGTNDTMINIMKAVKNGYVVRKGERV